MDTGHRYVFRKTNNAPHYGEKGTGMRYIAAGWAFASRLDWPYFDPTYGSAVYMGFRCVS